MEYVKEIDSITDLKSIIDNTVNNTKRIKGKLRLDLYNGDGIDLKINCSRKRGEIRK
jgi:hypothetical protein